MGEKILVVDDDIQIANMLRDIIEPLGYQVEICSNGLEVISTLHSYKPNLLIMDVMLPGIDGYSLTSTISEDTELTGLPIIVVSALEASRSMFSRFPQVTAFLTKPFNITDLLEAVNTALAKKEI